MLNLKNTLVNNLLVVLAIIGLPSLISSIVSLKYAESFPYFSLTGYAIILLMLFIRKKLPFQLKAVVLLLIGYLIGTKGLISEGIIGDGLFFYFIVSVIAAMILGTIQGIIVMLVSVITGLIIAYSYSKGWLTYHFDIKSYVNTPAIWYSFLLITLLFISGVIIISGKLNDYLYRIIKNLSDGTKKLNEVNLKLEKEIENRKAIELSLKNSAGTFKNIFNSINDAIIIFDEKNRIVEANQAFYHFTGYDREQLHLLKIEDLFEDYERIRLSLFDGNTNIFSPYRNEVNLRTKNRENSILVDMALIPFPDEKSGTNLIILRDITENMQLERMTLNAIIQAEEKERSRVSQDLHDSLGPLLSAIKLYSNSIVDASEGTKRKEIYTKITELMDEAVKTVKEISNNLSSHILNNFGLPDALNSFADKIELTYPIKIMRNFEEEFKTSEAIQITLYRVIVELINNTLKYAYASRVNINLTTKKDKIMIVYKDNGNGFDVEKEIIEGKGMGLYNIHSRIKSLGGNISMESKEGKGVKVEIQI